MFIARRPQILNDFSSEATKLITTKVHMKHPGVGKEDIHTALVIRATYTLRPYMEGSLQVFVLRTNVPIASELYLST